MSSPRAPRPDHLTRFQVKGGRPKGKQISLRPWAEDEDFLEGLGAEKSEWIREVIHAAIAKTKAPTKPAEAEK